MCYGPIVPRTFSATLFATIVKSLVKSVGDRMSWWSNERNTVGRSGQTLEL